MGGVASTVGRIGSGVLTLGGSEIARNNLGPNSVVSKALQTPGTILTGGASKMGVDTGGGSSYTPTQLSPEDSKMVLAQSGGAPLLANIAMGADVEDTLAGYFGRTKGADWEAYKANLSPDERAAIDGVKTQLTEIQSNSNLRNQAVQQIVNDFPNIAAQAATAQKAAKSNAGEDFDSTTKAYIDQALSGVAAKYAANGSLSSGAAAEASARAGAALGMDKLGYVTGEGDKAYSKTYGSGLDAWQARYNEANALRNFQNTMTQGAAGQGFSAIQASLNRTQQTNMFNAGAVNQKNATDTATKNANDNALFGSIGSLAGTVAGAYVAGPIGAKIGGTVGGTAAKSTTTAGAPDFANWG